MMNAINSARRMKLIEQFENLHLNGYVTMVNEIEQLRQRVRELEELLKESYKDANEVLRPRVQELEEDRDRWRTDCHTYCDAMHKREAAITSLQAERDHWKNNHETEVRRARMLKERTDMPIERVQAYEKWGEDQARIAKLTAERDKAHQYWQIAEGRCDALMKQRDELVATLILASCCLEPNTSSATVNQIEAAIASVKEKS